MTVDEHKEHLLDIMDSMPDDACGDWRDSLAYAIETMHKYQQLQADYENRLKADKIAMLTEIDLEMSEQSFGIQTESWEVVEKLRKEIIQQKINELEKQLK